MRLKVKFVHQEVAGYNIATAAGYSGALQPNNTGVYILQLLAEDTTEERVVEQMCEIYDAPREEIAEDVRNFIMELREKGLVED